MSTTKAVLNQVKALLEADATLSGYVKQFTLGFRETAPGASFPIIMIEPVRMDETYASYPQVEGSFLITIAAFTLTFDADAQVVGNASYKGILELEKDIKKALEAYYPTLQNTVVEFLFPSTTFAISDNLSKYPCRGVYLDMLIHMRTTMGTRT